MAGTGDRITPAAASAAAARDSPNVRVGADSYSDRLHILFLPVRRALLMDPFHGPNKLLAPSRMILLTPLSSTRSLNSNLKGR